MPNNDNTKTHRLIHKGLNEAQHQMLREKAMLNQTVVRSDEDGNLWEQPAKETLWELYQETI